MTWSYDAFGNRDTQTVTGSPEAPVPQSSMVQYSATSNRITEAPTAPSGYGYDGEGNVTNDGINGYAYDGEGRLCAVYNSFTGSYTGYLYDGDGHRVAAGSITSLSCNFATNGFTATAEYVIGQSGQVLSKTDGSGNLQWSNVYANGSLLATYANNTTYFNLNDWLGTKRVVAHPDGTVAETCLSLPYGDELNCNGTDPSQQHFTGKERDLESGNDYFGARYYASTMGRFLSPDPSALAYADPTNPQSLNLYAYVLDNPLTNVDPTGLDCVYDNGDGTVSTGTGDCDNSTEALANAGHYIDCDGCTSGAAGANLDAATGSLYLTDASGNGIGGTTVSDFADPQGTPATDVTVNGSAPYLDTISGFGTLPDIDSQRIQQLALGVTSFGIPNVCAFGLTARAGLPGSRLSFGVDANTQKGIRAAGGARIASLGGVQGSVSVKGTSVSATISTPIPGAPFTAGVSTKGSSITGVNVGRSVKGVNVQAYADIGTFADPNCR
jgi:RHS repeat-associated protein